MCTYFYFNLLNLYIRILIKTKLAKYKSIDNIIKALNESFILSEDEQEEDMYQANIDSDFSKVKIAEEEKPENRKN